MHLDRRFLVIVGSSLAWGLIVSLVFYRMALVGRSQAQEKTLVVAAEPLAPGAAVAAGAVKTMRVQANLFPKGGYARVEDVVGRPVISSIEPDEPVVDSRLAARGSGFGVAPMIPTGMRAVSVRVNDVAGVAGFVLPGMHVDVLVTGRPPNETGTRPPRFCKTFWCFPPDRRCSPTRAARRCRLPPSRCWWIPRRPRR